MERLLRLQAMHRGAPTPKLTHTFTFDHMPRAFEVMDQKLEGVLTPLMAFE